VRSATLLILVSVFGCYPFLPCAAQSAEKGVVVESSTGMAPLPDGYYSGLHVLAIGINNYNHPAIPDLSYAEADAVAVAKILGENYGFQDSRTLLGEEATRQGITAAVGEFFKPNRVSSSDAVVIYFSGHGQTIDLATGGEMGFLIPQDAQINLEGETDVAGYYQSCIPMQDIKTWRSLIPAKHILIVADSCYSGLLANDRSLPAPVLDALKLSVCQILTAGTRNQKAREQPEYGHGTYTAKFLEALRTGVADLNKDGCIRASELGQYLKDVNIQDQTPQSKVMDGEGDFILVARRLADGYVSGTVLDQKTKEPLRGARVRLSGSTVDDRTNTKGEFRLRVPVGGYSGFAVELPRVSKSFDVSEPVNVSESEEEFVELVVPVPADALGGGDDLPKGWTNETDSMGGILRVWTLKDAPSRPQPKDIWRIPLQETGEVYDLVWVEPGKFLMGSPVNEPERDTDEDQHEVEISRGFWMGRYEVTNRQFAAFVDDTGYLTTAEEDEESFAWSGTEWLTFEGLNWREPVVQDSPHLGDDYPVIQVSWEDCQAFLDWAGLTFPSEAQWEYACRAGTVTPCYWGHDQTVDACRYANVADASMCALFEVRGTGFDCDDGYASTGEVGSFLPNAFGLYDMLGNVAEWCLDKYQEEYDSTSPLRDPVNRNGDKITYHTGEHEFHGDNRVVRGGSWTSLSKRLRAASRDRLHPTDRATTTGFRACKARGE
jgi:formylglycine-generating enzyme